ncbi:MAG: MjaI family restriction endonuclease [Schwartzia sp.]|nr:MjaI family restriction endonuclease [Schwartzia sp. (in: firmicutes)]
MMNTKISNKMVEHYNESENFVFPQYTSQLINWANQNAQGTRPAVVGQMLALFPIRSSRKRIILEPVKII